MRGNVYRFGRRRAGSFVLAIGAALMLALGCASAAAAKAPIRASGVQVTVQAKPPVIAHAAGHKIA
jgi:predicted component of type VI protein secretion system